MKIFRNAILIVTIFSLSILSCSNKKQSTYKVSYSSSYLPNSNTGKIVGKVVDKSNGEGLAGTHVIILGTKIKVKANIKGLFSIEEVPPGSYNIRAIMIGYEPVIAKNIKVEKRKTAVVNFELLLQVIKVPSIY